MKSEPKYRLTVGQAFFINSLGIVVLVLILISALFFAVFSRTSDALVESQSREINKQIVFNYESYINSVIETANYVQFASSNLDLNRDAYALQELYLVNAAIKQDVVSIFLFSSDGRKLVGGNSRLDAEAVLRSRWFTAASGQRDIYHFTGGGERTIGEGGDEEVISVSRVVEFSAGGVPAEGILLIELNRNAITELAEKTNLGPHGHILIIDATDELVYSSENSDAGYSGDSFRLSSQTYLGGFAAEINGTEMYMSVNTLLLTRWRIVTVSNIDDIQSAQRRIVRYLILIFLGTVAFSAIVSALISMRISMPINQLKSIMAMVEQGDFTSTVIVSGQREIVLLSESFNRMVRKVRDLMDRLVSQQKEKQKTELRALQNQINPHFLYNTLDSIVWLAEHKRTEDVITTVVALARFFRISIARGETFIAVKDEIAHVESYLTIQRIRYVDKFEYLIDVEDELSGSSVMKLILQPLVENAIYHGTGDEGARITIEGRCRDGFLIFSVTNSGYGLTDEKIGEMYAIMHGERSGHGVGIRNVYRRLKLYYGEKADMRIASLPDESTRVTLYIPENDGGGL